MTRIPILPFCLCVESASSFIVQFCRFTVIDATSQFFNLLPNGCAAYGFIFICFSGFQTICTFMPSALKDSTTDHCIGCYTTSLNFSLCASAIIIGISYPFRYQAPRIYSFSFFPDFALKVLSSIKCSSLCGSVMQLSCQPSLFERRAT